MRDAVVTWGRARWPGARVMHELQVGGCRVDLGFVRPDNLVGVEIKSSRDVLKRLDRQIKHFTWGLPETWIAFAPRWLDEVMSDTVPYEIGRVMVTGSLVEEEFPYSSESEQRYPHAAHRNLMHTTPMLNLLLKDELLTLCDHHRIQHKTRMTCRDLLERLARGLTGDQIVFGVCAQLRARKVGWIADEPIIAAKVA